MYIYFYFTAKECHFHMLSWMPCFQVTGSDCYLQVIILYAQLLVHAVTVYNGKCTYTPWQLYWMLLDPLSFLSDLLLHRTVSYIYLWENQLASDEIQSTLYSNIFSSCYFLVTALTHLLIAQIYFSNCTGIEKVL